jgi:hypothetical protein
VKAVDSVLTDGLWFISSLKFLQSPFSLYPSYKLFLGQCHLIFLYCFSSVLADKFSYEGCYRKLPLRLSRKHTTSSILSSRETDMLKKFQFSAIELAFGIAFGLQDPTQHSGFGGGLPQRPSTTLTPPLRGAQVYSLRLLPNYHHKPLTSLSVAIRLAGF